jgi:hypothetical protein
VELTIPLVEAAAEVAPLEADSASSLMLQSLMESAADAALAAQAPTRTPTPSPNSMATEGETTSPASPAAEPDKPVVRWLLPVTEGGYYVSTQFVRLLVTATDTSGIDKVVFYRWDPTLPVPDYVDIATVTGFPYEWYLDTTTLNFGWNEIDVKAYDTVGNVSDKLYIFLYLPPVYQAYIPLVSAGG